MTNKIKIEFENPYIEEANFGYTKNYSDWRLMLDEKANTTPYTSTYKLLTNGEFIEYFKDCAGFMLAPVAKYGTHVLEATSRKFKSIDDLKNNIDISKIFVYEINDCSGKKIIKGFEDQVYDLMYNRQPIPDEMLIVEENDYRIRYAELPD